MIVNALDTCRLGAVTATVNFVPSFKPVPHDFAAAMATFGGQRMDGAFEAVEEV